MQHAPASLSGFRGLRAELLVALKKAPHALTAKELAEQFGLTPNALRRHLDSLEAEGLVRYRREVRGVGAPVYAYSLTEGGQALFPQAYAPVLAAVLDAVDRGYRVVVATDALCSSSDQTHDASLAVYRNRYGQQVETATTDLILAHWK